MGGAGPTRSARTHPPELVLGFDIGTRRIGVAAGDSLTLSARAVATLSRKGGLPWREIERLVRDIGPARIVVGLPYNMDGSESALTGPARAFARQLASRFRLPVALVDERLSSREAEAELRRARQAGLRPRRIRHEDVDGAAASVIVRRWFEEGGDRKPGDDEANCE